MKAFLELLLVFYSEALFLIDDCEPEVLEGNVTGKESVGADDNVYAPVGNPLEGLHDFASAPEAAEEFDPDREITHPFPKGSPVLFSKDGGRHQKSDLSSAGHGLEGCPDSHFGFPKTYVSADEAVHGLAGLHVLLGLRDGP